MVRGTIHNPYIYFVLSVPEIGSHELLDHHTICNLFIKVVTNKYT